MGIQINPSRKLTATGGIAIKNVGHAQCLPEDASRKVTVARSCPLPSDLIRPQI
jgi:hypothetical protein